MPTTKQQHADTPPSGGAGDSGSSRIGLVLFWIYVLLYVGFMVLVLFRPDLLSILQFGGVNLAIAYGMGLIGSAFVLALIYMVARSKR